MNKPGSYWSYPGGGSPRGCNGADGVVGVGAHSGLVALCGGSAWRGDSYTSALSGMRGGSGRRQHLGVRASGYDPDRGIAVGVETKRPPVYEGDLTAGGWEMSEEHR